MPAASDTTEERWKSYLEWNAALATVVYGPEASGLPVFLDLEDELLEKVAVEAGGFGSNALPGASRCCAADFERARPPGRDVWRSPLQAHALAP